MSKRILVDYLTIEDEVGFRCRACPFKATQMGRLTKHIHNIHHSGPVVKCNECGSLHKNTNSLRAHIYRSHKEVWKANNLSASHTKPPTQRDTLQCPPPPPPTPQPTIRPVKERWVLHNSTAENHTMSSDRRSKRTPLSNEILSGCLTQVESLLAGGNQPTTRMEESARHLGPHVPYVLDGLGRSTTLPTIRSWSAHQL